jgi:hypothetical protein
MANKDGVVGKLITVVRALDSITVSGKNNLANLVGSISTLEEIIGVLQQSGGDTIGDE